MSFIDQQRKTAIEENNTAQEEFLNLLEHLDPSTPDIIVTIPLSGDLDCEVLRKCDFNNIVSLQFMAGNLTSLLNIPDGITKIICGENLLIEIPELPDSLVVLDLHQNGIGSVGALPMNIKELNLSENQIHSLENLPSGLEILHCDGNQLRTLNLSGIENLRVLHCSNNPLLVIEQLPDTLEDLEMENDVAVQIQRLQEDGEGEHSSEHSVEKRANYSECLYNYYEIKKRYEDTVRKLKRDIFKRNTSKKAALLKISGLKPKCIQCARPVGSVFKNEGRTLIAKCGDSEKPCSLDIQIFTGEYYRVSDIIQLYNNTIELAKQQIMVIKLDVLFGFLSEKDGVELFKESLDYFTKEKSHFSILKREYDLIYFDEDRKEKIFQKLKRIQEIRERIDQMSEIGLTDAMTAYIEELQPEIENLQLIKYDTREILEEDGQYTLLQNPWKIQQLEYTFGEYPKVIKYRYKSLLD